MKTIVIIGAGFSGAVTTVQLLRQHHTAPMRVVLVNGGERIARGMAYGTQSPDHTLNVPAGNMSALEDDAEHFLRFARTVDMRIDSGSFVPRQLYGDYLESLLEQTERDAPPHVKLERVFRYVASIHPANDAAGLVAQLDDGSTILADHIVLALGYFPSTLPIAGKGILSSKRYLGDPWEAGRMARIPVDQPVLLLGTGLTMVDTATTLLKQNPARPIIAVSRRGLVPHPHRHDGHRHGGDSGPRAIWGEATTVREQLCEFRRYVRRIAAQGRDWRDAMALLRPVATDIWLEYTEKERKRFLRHVQPYWDIHRHRLSPTLHQQLTESFQAGVIQTFAARIIGFDENTTDIEVTLRRRGAAQTIVVHAGAVINCTGPCADPRHSGNELVKQLLRDGLIRADRLGLGLEVGSDCAAIDQHGTSSDSLFYIGPWLKATYWEATAVPDLRRFALALAQRLSRS